MKIAFLMLLTSLSHAQVVRQNGFQTKSGVTKTANYTMTCSDDTIFANCSGVGGCTITLPPASCAAGQPANIIKVDTSSQPVTVAAGAVGDLISSSQTITMYAQGQSVKVKSNGSNNWWPIGDLPYVPNVLNFIGEPNSAAAPAAANSCHWCTFSIAEPLWISSFTYSAGATGSGNIYFAVADLTKNVLLKTDGQTIPNTGIQTSTITTGRALAPGTYYLGTCLTSVTTSLTRFGTGGSNLGCYFESPQAVVPSTATLRLGSGVRQYSIGVWGAGGQSDTP